MQRPAPPPPPSPATMRMAGSRTASPASFRASPSTPPATGIFRIPPSNSRPGSQVSHRNPFSTPSLSRAGSISERAPSSLGASSSYHYESAVGTTRFRSRRVRKGEAPPLPVRKKKAKENLHWIMPLVGVLLGLCCTGILIWYKLTTIVSHKYCPVLIDDFSSGTLDPKVWTKEVEVGGYGNHQFEMTTANDQNVFIQNGQLHIKPTLQDANLVEKNTVVNLLSDGTCTSNTWSNCVTATNTTNGTIVNPVLSGRINTKLGANIKYGKVEVTAKIPQGDWLWPGIWMMPKDSIYGAWPASGEIDIMESRGNNYSYSLGGNNFVSSSLHWGPDSSNDAWKLTTNNKAGLHSQFGDQFHTYGLIWSEKYLFTYIDNMLVQVLYVSFNKPLWPLGKFGLQNGNGTDLHNPWQGTGQDQTPFDQEFYLILNVAVGGTNGWFLDGADGKPWLDSSRSARKDFWDAQAQWLPTWAKSGEMVVNSVKMWQQCD